MEKYIVKELEYELTDDEFLRKIRVANDPEDEDCQKAISMLQEARLCARPKYAYALAPIEHKGEDHVIIAGHRIDSPLVRKNLDKIHRIIPYMATCGTEVDEWSRQQKGMMEHFWAEEIKIMLLSKAVIALHKVVKDRHFPGSDMSQMSPGSLPAWPITEQTNLFSLSEHINEEIGVSLTDSYLMIPSKSVSGFFFSSEVHYENCQLCPMNNCPGRRARYQPPVEA